MKIVLSFILLFTTFILNAQCSSTSLIIEQIRAKDTDSNINWELNKHFSYFNSSCTQIGILVVHLVGSYDNPSNSIVFPSHAANNGFHVLSLKYPNSTAAQSSCAASVDINCYSNFRKEIIEGGDFHPDINVDSTNSIYNRLLKLIQYLDINNPNQGWNNYYNANTIDWSKIIISGHSQGGGHAAYIAKNKSVKRVLMFASPNDYSSHFNSVANWTTQNHITPTTNYYGFNNLYDDVVDFSDQFEIWDALNMPIEGDSLCVNSNTSYFSSKQLYTTTTGTNANQNHSLMIRDDQLILNGLSESIFSDVWDYMLGITEGLSVGSNLKIENIQFYPNPVNEVIHFNKQLESVIIYNQAGQKTLSKKNTQSIRLNQKISKGIYTMHITTMSGIVLIKKFVKL